MLGDTASDVSTSGAVTSGATTTPTSSGNGTGSESTGTESTGTESTGSASSASTGEGSTGEGSTIDENFCDITGFDSTAGGAEEPQPVFACDNALWLTVIRPGQLIDVALDTRGHAIGFGVADEGRSRDALIVDLGPKAEVVRSLLSGRPFVDEIVAGAVDGSDNVYAIFPECNAHYYLRKFDVTGALIAQIDLGSYPGGSQGYYLAVAPNGALVTTSFDDGIVTRRDPDLAVVWEMPSDLSVHAVNNSGTAIATRWPNGLVMLDANGSIIWDIEWSLFDIPEVDINEAGQVVAGGRGNDQQLSVARFDSDGSLAWDTHFNVNDKFDSIYDVEINASGTIAISGTVMTSDLLGFAAKLDASGDVVAQHVCALGTESRGQAIALDETGGMRLAGTVHIDQVYRSFVAAYE